MDTPPTSIHQLIAIFLAITAFVGALTSFTCIHIRKNQKSIYNIFNGEGIRDNDILITFVILSLLLIIMTLIIGPQRGYLILILDSLRENDEDFGTSILISIATIFQIIFFYFVYKYIQYFRNVNSFFIKDGRKVDCLDSNTDNLMGVFSFFMLCIITLDTEAAILSSLDLLSIEKSLSALYKLASICVLGIFTIGMLYTKKILERERYMDM